MPDTPVSSSRAAYSPSQGRETAAHDDLATFLRGWVSACLDDGVQELDTIITTAPNSLKAAFCCYDVMADEIEIVVGLLKKSYGILPMTCVIGWSSEVANLLCR